MREMRSEANVSYKVCAFQEMFPRGGGGGEKKRGGVGGGGGWGGGAKNVHVKGEGENMRMGKRKENTSKTRV